MAAQTFMSTNNFGTARSRSSPQRRWSTRPRSPGPLLVHRWPYQPKRRHGLAHQLSHHRYWPQQHSRCSLRPKPSGGALKATWWNSGRQPVPQPSWCSRDSRPGARRPSTSRPLPRRASCRVAAVRLSLVRHWPGTAQPEDSRLRLRLLSELLPVMPANEAEVWAGSDCRMQDTGQSVNKLNVGGKGDWAVRYRRAWTVARLDAVCYRILSQVCSVMLSAPQFNCYILVVHWRLNYHMSLLSRMMSWTTTLRVSSKTIASCVRH